MTEQNLEEGRSRSPEAGELSLAAYGLLEVLRLSNVEDPDLQGAMARLEECFMEEAE